MIHLTYLQIACAQEYLLGSVFLFCRSEGIRARRLLAGGLLCCYANALLILWATPDDHMIPVAGTPFFPVSLIATGTFGAFLLLVYLLEVVHPGLMNWRNRVLAAIPCLCPILLYYLTVTISGKPVRVLSNGVELIRYFQEFNVWFRVILFLSGLLYVVGLFWLLANYHARHLQWCKQKALKALPGDLSWLRQAGWGLAPVMLLYLLWLFNGWEAAHEVFLLLCLLFFAFLIYKGLFHRGAGAISTQPAVALDASAVTGIYDSCLELPDGYVDETFEALLPGYADQVKKWMQTAQPYLRKDFKLIDVSEVLLLNRSYLSLVFNKGMGESFSQVVQQYRIEYAKALLQIYPEMHIEEVASRSGFAVPATFYSVFLKQAGVTPRQYRDQFIDNPSGKEGMCVTSKAGGV